MPTGGKSWTYFDVKVHSTCLEIFMVHCRKCHIFVRLSAQNVVLIFSAEEKHNLQKERKITAREERRMFPFWETINWVTAERTLKKISFYLFQMKFLNPFVGVCITKLFSENNNKGRSDTKETRKDVGIFLHLGHPHAPLENTHKVHFLSSQKINFLW